MWHYLWLIPFGFFTGSYGTLVGLGGGFIIVPVLLMVYPTSDPATVTSISLAVVLVNGISGSWAYARMHRIDYRTGTLFSLAAIPGAMGGALLATYIPRDMFQLGFGVLMLLVSVLLFLRPEDKKAPSASPALPTPQPPTPPVAIHSSRNTIIGIMASVGIGLLSSLSGIGGGIIYVPMFIYLMRFPIHSATATSQFILLFSALAGTITHVATSTFHDGWWQVLFLSIGVMFGAPFGAHISTRLNGVWIVRSLAIAMAVTGLKFVFSAFV